MTDPTFKMSGRFRFSNLGPIKSAELSLGELTLIAGKNNTGKTYLTYALYGFLKMWNTPTYRFGRQRFRGIFSRPLISRSMRRGRLIIDEYPRLVEESGDVTISLNRKRFNRDRKTIAEAYSLSFSAAVLPDVFSSTPDIFEGAGVEFQLGDTAIKTDTSTVELPFGATMQIEFSPDSDVVTLSLRGIPKRSKSGDYYYPVLDGYISLLFPEFRHQVSVLSAERFSIALFYRELDFTKNQLIDMVQKLRSRKGADNFLISRLIEEGTSYYALPIKDNIDFTRSIPHIQREQSDLYGDKLYAEIKTLMKGYYASEHGELRFKSMARGPNRFDVPLYLASSSARGLSDLYFFLRHVAEKHHLLIIDEPESHLDTTNQILLARLLVHFVKTGIRVLVTTHSDYLLKEINNLIMLCNDFEHKEEVVKELGYSDKDFLCPDHVHAYVAEGGGLTECVVDEFGIDMPVFDTTIDRINRVSNELSSRIKKHSIE